LLQFREDPKIVPAAHAQSARKNFRAETRIINAQAIASSENMME